MDVQRYEVLTALVKEARIEDKKLCDEMEAAKTRWKAANEILTDRMKVLDTFVSAQKAEDIGL